MRIPRIVKELSVPFASRGFQCFLVGGAVRDILSGREHGDFDIATDALPDEVRRLFRRVIPTGIAHGTVTVLFRGTRFEVTTFRTESEYSDGRRPDSVSFTPSILTDLARRDFTINAIACDLLADDILDPYNGREDLANGIIRAIGEPLDRFREDGLRPLRAVRFSAQLGFQVEERTRAAIPQALDLVAGVSAERVRDEILKIVQSPVPSVGFILMRDTGILGVVMPELQEGVGVRQGSLHCHDVFLHSLYACDAAPRDSLVLRLAALLHDIGKPRARAVERDGAPANGAQDTPTFHGHEKISSEMTAEILERLRLPSATSKSVAHLVAHHMFNYHDEWSDAAVRRFIARVGEENIQDIIRLRRADQIGMCPGNSTLFPEGLARFAQRVARVMEAGRAFTVAQLAVDGNDVMERLGLQPGPKVGTILTQLLQAVLEDPALNEREALLGIAERLYRERIAPGGAPGGA